MLAYEGQSFFLPAPHRAGPLVDLKLNSGWHSVVVKIRGCTKASQFGWIVADEDSHLAVDLKYDCRRRLAS